MKITTKCNSNSRALAFETQNLIDDLFMPRVTAQTKIIEENPRENLPTKKDY